MSAGIIKTARKYRTFFVINVGKDRFQPLNLRFATGDPEPGVGAEVRDSLILLARLSHHNSWKTTLLELTKRICLTFVEACV
jgi:hypothetical protein